jgi:hypothetical protein
MFAAAVMLEQNTGQMQNEGWQKLNTTCARNGSACPSAAAQTATKMGIDCSLQFD